MGFGGVLGGGMALFNRLAFVLLLLCGTNVFAAFPASDTQFRNQADGSSVWRSTNTEACNDYQAYKNAQDAPCFVYSGASASGNQCSIYGAGQAACNRQGQVYDLVGTLAQQSVPAVCPSGSTLSGGSCTCNAPLVQNAANNGCSSPPADDPVAKCNQLNLMTDSRTYSSGYSLDLCDAGVIIHGSSAAKTETGSTVYGPYTCTAASGGACPSSIPTPVAAPSQLCPVGQTLGTVNGIKICSPPANITVQGPRSSAAPPADGSAPPPIAGAPAGATGSSSVTVCSSGACNTTTTYVGAGGAPLGVKEESEPQASYCSRNPTVAACKGKEPAPSSFSGNCTGVFVGKGDALLVAAAEGIQKAKCLLDSGPGLEDARVALEAGTFAEPLEVKNKTVSQFNTTNPLGGGCPGDQFVSLGAMGSFSIPLSNMCVFLEALGKIAVLVTLVSCTLFVIKGFS